MKTRFSLLIFTFLALAGLLSACSGAAFTPSGFSGVTIDQNTAYIANNQHVYAVNLADGTQKWRYPDKASGSITFFSTPALTKDNQLIAGSYDNTLYSLNPANGQENSWKFKAGSHFVAGPTVTDQAIYAPNADFNLYDLNLQGVKQWAYSTKAALWAVPAYDSKCGCLYLASMDHNVYAIRADNGNLLWKRDLGSAVTGTPTMGQDGRLYVGDFGSEMVALNAQNGEVLWRTPLKGWVWDGPALDNGNLYFGDLNGNFYALSASNGAILWQINLDGSIIGAPLVTKDAIYFATENGIVYSIDRNGKSFWKQTVGGKIYTTPIASGDVILIAPMQTDAILVAMNTNGSTKWSFVPPK